MSGWKRKRVGLWAFIFLPFFLGQFAWPVQAASVLQVVLRDSRQVIWERPIVPGELFYLIHRNSIYGSLVWEAFSVDSKGSIWLNRVKTEHPAVLEYYGLEETTKDWISLSREIGRIPLLITALGETRLEWGTESLALSDRIPDGTLIEIRTRELP